MELIIVTGQSGAGKSHAVQCLEDIGYYCIDNLPPALIRSCFDMLDKNKIQKIAFVTDIRGREFFKELNLVLESLDNDNIPYKIIYLEAQTVVLLRRYQETRRIHPLAVDGNNEKGIEREKKMLVSLRSKANIIIDTSEMKTSALALEIKKNLAVKTEEDFSIAIQSFGYKNGMPSQADWIIDVRFVPNPYYVESLKKLTGKNKKVKEFVLGYSETQEFVGKITGLIIDLIPRYIHEGKYHLVVAFGCTGGRHRSVAIAEEVAAHLKECGQRVSVNHRDL